METQSSIKSPEAPTSIHGAGPRKRVLVVNAFIDEFGRQKGSPYRIPMAMGHIFLAGAFSETLCEVKVYSEQYSGPLKDLKLLAWADMLVMTGVTTSFDRMLQLTAYARALNPAVIVVAGGPPIRALPKLSRRYFDYVCLGPVEELREVARDAFGPGYESDEFFPRFDLGPKTHLLGFVESSRACNFSCSFCSLTGEKERYQPYDLEYVRRQILAVGKKQLVFIDNNFYGNDRKHFRMRVEMLRELYRDGRIKGWSALVTGDFFAKKENLELVAEAGCKSLFSGIESFDPETLRSYNKKQNTLVPQIEMIQRCLDAGILFSYGVMLDPTTRPIAELEQEIEFIFSRPEITAPAFFTLAIPLLGTPYFNDCIRQERLFPKTALRHLDGVTLAMKTLDPTEVALRFVQDLPNMRGHRRSLFRHLRGFLSHYRGKLEPLQLYSSVVTALLIGTTSAASSPLQWLSRDGKAEYFGPTKPLDPQYQPLMRLPERFRRHFEPTYVTNAKGELAAELAPDLEVGPVLQAAQ